MKIVKHGTRGSHWGRSSNNDELVIHHGRGQIQLSRGQALQLWGDLAVALRNLEEENDLE